MIYDITVTILERLLFGICMGSTYYRRYRPLTAIIQKRQSPALFPARQRRISLYRLVFDIEGDKDSKGSPLHCGSSLAHYCLKSSGLTSSSINGGIERGRSSSKALQAFVQIFKCVYHTESSCPLAPHATWPTSEPPIRPPQLLSRPSPYTILSCLAEPQVVQDHLRNQLSFVICRRFLDMQVHRLL